MDCSEGGPAELCIAGLLFKEWPCFWKRVFGNDITVIPLRFSFDPRKSARLRANLKRGIGFEDAQEVFSRPYYLDQRSDLPEQYRAIGWVGIGCMP